MNVGGGGNGWLFRTRTERDAELFVREQERRRGPRPSRREQLIAMLVLAVVFAAWGLWTLVTR